MKKVNLLSKAEMRKVMGGVVPIEDDCATNECTTSGESCTRPGTTSTGKCTKYKCGPNNVDKLYCMDGKAEEV